MNIENKARKFYDCFNKVKRLRKYDHPVVKAHVIDKINFIKENIELSKTTKVLEVGAGNGYFSHYLEDSCDLLATDVNKETLTLNPTKNKKVCDVNKLPFKNNSFDVVTSFDILHHVNNPERAVKEITRVSKKYVVLVEPNGDNIIQRAIFLPVPREWGINRFTTKYFKNIIKKNRLKILEFEHIGRLFTPNMPLPYAFIKKMPYSKSSQLNFHNIAICVKERAFDRKSKEQDL
ncbi:MAG: class I SAM-dependent methyltransferase [Candidatus Woesearchaeota archaeon]|nr:class I SAM-dependent methyltransferase [Candidatus Woesearchaeota archaeon]